MVTNKTSYDSVVLTKTAVVIRGFLPIDANRSKETKTDLTELNNNETEFGFNIEHTKLLACLVAPCHGFTTVFN